MSLDPYKNDWDTPPDGDFVRYVERLNAQPPVSVPATAAAPSSARKKTATTAKKAVTPTPVATSPTASGGLWPLLQQLRQLWLEAAEQQRQQQHKH